MNLEHVRSRLVCAAKEVKGVEIPPANGSLTLEDLGLDSLDLIEIGMVLEEEFNCVFEEDSFDDAVTFDDVIAAILQQLT